MKNIVLCADDFGQALAVSEAIVTLIKLKRISATSCIVNNDNWSKHAQLLLPYREQIDIGLHFNLTEGLAISKEYKKIYGERYQHLSTVMMKSATRFLKLKPIYYECLAQLDRFQQALGCLPDYIDGHHHIHQFPIIRDAIVNVFKDKVKKGYIRLVEDKPFNGLNLKPYVLINTLKKTVISLTGTSAFKKLLTNNKIPHNTSFSGIYPFNTSEPYRNIFLECLSRIKTKGVIMSHPSLEMAKQNAFNHKRYQEYQYLSSDQFIQDCERAKVYITRFF